MFDQLNFSGRKILPSLLQSEISECGLTCIAMISAYFGDVLTISQIRTETAMGQRGATIAQLMHAVQGQGLTCRAIRCNLNELDSFPQPVILHWDFNHYVVLKKYRKKDLVLHDPAVGIRHLSHQEATLHFTGVVLELNPGNSFKQRKKKNNLKLTDFFKDIKGLIPTLAQILLLAFILQIIALLSPFYTQLVVDDVLVKRDVNLLIVLATGFGLLSLVSVATQLIRGWASIYLTHQLSFQLGASLFHHLIHLPVAFFQKRHMGDIVSRFGSLAAIQNFITGSAIAVLLDGLMAITTLLVVFAYSPLLALIVVGTIFLDFFLQLTFFHPIKTRANEQLIAEAKLDSHFMETIRSINPIKRFGTEVERSNDWQNRFSDAINGHIRVDKLSLALDTVSSLIAGISNIAIIYIGALQVLDNKMSMGMLFAFIAYKNQLQSALGSLVSEYITYLMLSLHFDRLADIKLETANFKQQPAQPLSGELQLKAVSFRYDADSPWLIRGLNLNMKVGEELVIYGPSGCGKSTLLSLLQGYRTDFRGEILFDKHLLSSVGLQSIQTNFASVMQEDQLLAGSIKSNIAFGEPVVDWQRLQNAANIAEIHDEICSLPMAYESLVGDLGVCLSAGQVQRILIARAIYRQPKILLLDEGTAHLDKRTAKKVLANIRKLNITRIYITHETSELGNCDIILFMRDGKHQLRKNKRQLEGQNSH